LDDFVIHCAERDVYPKSMSSEERVGSIWKNVAISIRPSTFALKDVARRILSTPGSTDSIQEGTVAWMGEFAECGHEVEFSC
jgi:hypothetical protein